MFFAGVVVRAAFEVQDLLDGQCFVLFLRSFEYDAFKIHLVINQTRWDGIFEVVSIDVTE